MRIVRTVGQAFEVCHKLSMDHNSYTEERSEQSGSEPERCSPEPFNDLDEIKKGKSMSKNFRKHLTSLLEFFYSSDSQRNS